MAGAPLITPALILGSLHYGETSRIVRLATRESGVISAIAKGALRPKSRFGASLQLFSEGQAHLILSPSRDLHLLTAFDITTTHSGLAGNLEGFLAASALAELAVRFVPPGPSEALYHLLVNAVRGLEEAASAELPALGLRLLWQLIEELGVAPSLDGCARDGGPIQTGEGAAFSLEEGGLLCAVCAGAVRTGTRLAASDVAALSSLLDPNSELPELSPAHAAAHRRLLVRWVRYHLGEGELPALDFWHRGLSA